MADEIRRVQTRKAIVDRSRADSGRGWGRRKYHVAFATGGLFILILTGIIVAGYVMIFVLPPRKLMVRVDDIKYTRGDLVKLLRAQQAGQEAVGQDFSSSEAIFTALQRLVEDAIMTRSAPKLGVTVSEEEVDFLVMAQMTPRGVDSIQDPDQIKREAQERYKTYLNTTQLSDSEYRNVVRSSLLRRKITQLIGESVPTVTEQVHVHRIVMIESDETDVMQIKLNDRIGGSKNSQEIEEAIEEAVKEFSRDNPEIVRRGGDLGWVPRDILSDYDSAFFDLEVGVLSEPTLNRDKAMEIFYFVVSERSDAREISSSDREVLKNQALQDWVNKERPNHDVFAVFNSDIYSWLIEQLGISRTTPVPTPQTGPLGF